MARRLIAAALLFHLAALAVSYLALIEPSASHSRVLAWLTPYLRSTHFAADGRRFYLAHATPDEQPHRLQYASARKDQRLNLGPTTRWRTVEPSGIPGLARSDRYGRWMNLITTLAETDQVGLTATLLLPLVESDPTIDAIRVVRLPTELTTAAQDAQRPVYAARVVRESDGVELVALEPRRLTTAPRRPADDAPAE